MASISVEEFEKQLQKQKEANNASKWRDLEKNKIYTITNLEFFPSQYGEICILTLNNDQRVFSPSCLTNRLKEDNKPLPRYVRPIGITESKRNPNQKYYSFDLV